MRLTRNETAKGPIALFVPTGAATTMATASPVEQDLAAIAWDIASGYACTGLGGSTIIAPYPVAVDPMQNPLPLSWGMTCETPPLKTPFKARFNVPFSKTR